MTTTTTTPDRSTADRRARRVRPDGLTATLALALAAAVAAAGCSPAGATPDRSADHAGKAPAAASDTPSTAADLPIDDATGHSIYLVESVWTDQHGESRTLRSLEGRPQVVAMAFTSCGYACPVLILDMMRIEDRLGDDADRVGFLVVSIDPERDTPEQLATYAAGARLGPDRWTLLTGDPGDILELAALLGVQYRHLASGDIVHSNLITVLDADGRIVHRQLGLEADPTPTLAALRALLD